MQLSYRGIAYNSATSAVKVTSGQTVGQYRGAALRAQRFTLPLTYKFSVGTQYRGVGSQSVATSSGSNLASSF
ncbi:DUF4278 domain-containing protein [Leptolyngbya sp. FACHB-261]|uniref:DUF4278 domain-containing protein n=1 Tax=Leptolyngbya sp. FACHB-261 TaxID=2692806 RepID=UPI001681D0FD|nr:DUF4278 domain-containing protein [Leptolyngbya sp. FACHB-261]MBD2101841.1 DUF4278 domain-containing protein [Leptolyngbya sp. FACHB-261]